MDFPGFSIKTAFDISSSPYFCFGFNLKITTFNSMFHMFGYNICSYIYEDAFFFLLQVPTINQDTGIGGTEPNETLMKIRSDKVLRPDKKQQGKVRMGL
jgi:hypothetical protein